MTEGAEIKAKFFHNKDDEDTPELHRKFRGKVYRGQVRHTCTRPHCLCLTSAPHTSEQHTCRAPFGPHTAVVVWGSGELETRGNTFADCVSPSAMYVHVCVFVFCCPS